MDQGEIIEVETTEVPEANRELDGFLGITQTIDITPKPKNFTWDEVNELEQLYNQIEDEDE